MFKNIFPIRSNKPHAKKKKLPEVAGCDFVSSDTRLELSRFSTRMEREYYSAQIKEPSTLNLVSPYAMMTGK